MINGAHLHLMVNHFPVIGILFSTLLLLYGLARKERRDQEGRPRSFCPACVHNGAGLFHRRGRPESSEEPSRRDRGFHRQARGSGGLSLVLIETLGIASLAGLYFFRHAAAIPKWFIAMVLVISVSAAAVVGFTANLGGQIRHTEIREGFAFPAAPVPK